MGNFAFQDPLWFFALLALPLVALLRRRRRTPALVVPFAAEWYRQTPATFTSWPAMTGYLAAGLLIGALARPQAVNEKRETRQQGYDIVLAIDLSTSMLTEDFERDGRRINRLQAVKPVLEAFINRRGNDRIGLVVFAGHAYTLAPLTFDHDWLGQQVGRLKIGLLENGTAIGDALGVALSRVDQGRRELGAGREGAFVILLTDGENNAGALDPREAVRLATERQVIVHTIGAGREGLVPVPVLGKEGEVLGYRRMMSEIDEPLLREIAERTNGLFFRADDSRAVADAFAAIDRAQKIEFESRAMVVTDELFAWFAIPGLVLLVLAVMGAGVQSHQEVLA